MQEDLWVPKLARTAGHPSKGLYLEKRKRDISHVLFLDHLFLQWIPVHQFLCGVPTKNISVEDCKSAINVHTARNTIEAVESPTVNEGKVWNQNMDWLLWDSPFQPILHWAFPSMANGKRMLPWIKSLQAAVIERSFYLTCSSRLRSLASRGASLASPECNITAGNV